MVETRPLKNFEFTFDLCFFFLFFLGFHGNHILVEPAIPITPVKFPEEMAKQIFLQKCSQIFMGAGTLVVYCTGQNL